MNLHLENHGCMLGGDECILRHKIVFITALNSPKQTDACLVCCETNCNGCYLQSRKNLNMTENCKIVAYIPPNMDLKVVSASFCFLF